MGFELYNLPQGKILIAFSDKSLSVGTLQLNPKQELSKHNRPVPESLFQLKGSCAMKMFEEDGRIKEIVLNEGDSLDIPPLRYHIHSNPNDDVSITFWKASGDITEIIDNIRKNSKV
jgi:oxalate decarboxylase/phosphoglucose isomerase-like protein (cupin superfamily)